MKSKRRTNQEIGLDQIKFVAALAKCKYLNKRDMLSSTARKPRCHARNNEYLVKYQNYIHADCERFMEVREVVELWNYSSFYLRK